MSCVSAETGLHVPATSTQAMSEMFVTFCACMMGAPFLCMGQALCSPLVAILVTMQLDTGILIANYQQVWRPAGHVA